MAFLNRCKNKNNANHSCFADKEGYCNLLTNCDFKCNVCPFYKTEEAYFNSDKKAHWKNTDGTLMNIDKDIK
jgi:hypothetical protein